MCKGVRDEFAQHPPTDPTGYRTNDLLVMSPTPYPLGHGSTQWFLCTGLFCSSMKVLDREKFSYYRGGLNREVVLIGASTQWPGKLAFIEAIWSVLFILKVSLI